MTSDGTWTYSWNEENRLSSAIKTDDTKVEFVYDGLGRRRVKKVYSWVASAWSLTSETRFVYDGNNLVAELDGSNAVQKTHTWGLDLTGSLTASGGVGALLATNDGTTTNYPTFDGNGNITSWLDSSDNVTYSCTYSPFGRPIEETGTKPASFGFSTKPYDAETGLNYYRFRYYNSNLGRWINRDPIGENGGENLYAMVGNDTMNKWDYLGQYPFEHWGAFFWHFMPSFEEKVDIPINPNSSLAKEFRNDEFVREKIRMVKTSLKLDAMKEAKMLGKCERGQLTKSGDVAVHPQLKYREKYGILSEITIHQFTNHGAMSTCTFF